MSGRRAPSLREIETLAEAALATIPDAMRRQIGPLVIRVEEFADEETEEEMELESPFDLLCLDRGGVRPHKSVTGTRAEPDMVFLYRRPILDYWCETGDTLDAVVRHVLIHEIGHHLGFSDEDMERIEEG